MGSSGSLYLQKGMPLFQSCHSSSLSAKSCDELSGSQINSFLYLFTLRRLCAIISHTAMSASMSTTAAPSTYSPTPIANDTYYIGAQSFGVVLAFTTASGNLSTSNFTGDTSQQVYHPYSYYLCPCRTDTT